MKVMLEDFIESFPEQMEHLPRLRFVEQYDPDDYTNKSEEYAFVASMAQEVKLSIDIHDFMKQHEPTEGELQALVELKSSLQVPPEVELGWYLVVCSDLVREPPATPTHNSNGAPHGFLNSEYTPRTTSRRRRTLTKRSRDNDPDARAFVGQHSNLTNTTLSLRRRKSDATESQSRSRPSSSSKERRPQTAVNTKMMDGELESAASPTIGRRAGALSPTGDGGMPNGSLTPREGGRLRTAFSRFFNGTGA